MCVFVPLALDVNAGPQDLLHPALGDYRSVSAGAWVLVVGYVSLIDSLSQENVMGWDREAVDLLVCFSQGGLALVHINAAPVDLAHDALWDSPLVSAGEWHRVDLVGVREGFQLGSVALGTATGRDQRAALVVFF
jgi:hypothetical protein